MTTDELAARPDDNMTQSQAIRHLYERLELYEAEAFYHREVPSPIEALHIVRRDLEDALRRPTFDPTVSHGRKAPR